MTTAADKQAIPTADYYCDELDTFVTARYGWHFCPYCGKPLALRVTIVPNAHETRVRP